MVAEIIAVGSEMLTAGRLDTNSLFLTEQLNGLGIEVVAKHVIGDDRRQLAEAIKRALSDSEILILSGGLGPTEDDVTRDAVAQAFGLTFHTDDSIVESMERRFRAMSRTMPDINRRQAQILDGAEVLSNDRGTAPGQWIAVDGRFVLLLPGPPGELKSMFAREGLPRIAKIAPPMAIHTLVIRATGLSESQLDQKISPFYLGRENLVTTILAHDGDLQVRLRAQCADAAAAQTLCEEVGARIVETLGEHVYSLDDSPLEAMVGKRLMAARATLTLAESATGGGVAQRITSVAGSSEYFRGGFVTYSHAMKTAVLGIPAETIAQFGAVSEEVARAMAERARTIAGTDWAVSVTGNAGPGTDGPQATAGTFYFGIAGPDGTTVVQRMWPVGDRGRIRAFAVQAALDLLNRRLRKITQPA